MNRVEAFRKWLFRPKPVSEATYEELFSDRYSDADAYPELIRRLKPIVKGMAECDDPATAEEVTNGILQFQHGFHRADDQDLTRELAALLRIPPEEGLAMTLKQPVCSRVVVLKDPTSYRTEELEEISSSYRESTSDVYWIRAREAGKFAKVDELVVGDRCVLKMTQTPSSAAQAVNLLLKSIVNDPFQAMTEREQINDLMSRSTAVKLGGHFCADFQGLFNIQMLAGDIHQQNR